MISLIRDIMLIVSTVVYLSINQVQLQHIIDNVKAVFGG